MARKNLQLKKSVKPTLNDIQKAISYVKAGGTIKAIEEKYALTEDQVNELNTI